MKSRQVAAINFSVYLPDYDGASTSEARDGTEKSLEQQEAEDGGDGVSSEGEKPSPMGGTEVSQLEFDRNSPMLTSYHHQDDTSEADMLEQPPSTRQTRSLSRGSPTSPMRGRGMRGMRGGNRIQPIIWNQHESHQMMGGK